MNWRDICRTYNRRLRCSHRKGTSPDRGSFGIPSPVADYNVAMHTFIDGTQKIWCMCGCGFEVFNKPDWRFKWQYALTLVKCSTNSPSSSEVLGTPAGPINPARAPGDSVAVAYDYYDVPSNEQKESPIKSILRAWNKGKRIL